MTLVTITDLNQWQFVFPNILALENMKRKYEFYIFGKNRHTTDLINFNLSNAKIKYGNIKVDVLPSFFSVFDIQETETNHSWITATTLDRFVIPVATNIGKFIWVDTDTLIISEDIFKIFKEDTSEKGIAAVACDTLLHDHIIHFSRAAFLLDIAKGNSSTFNAGVTLIDPEKFRKNKYEDLIKEVFERSGGAYVNDEVILNLYDQEYRLLTPRFNCITHKAFLPRDPIVVHFSGQEYKPWVEHNYKGPYLKYYKLWEYYYGVMFT